MLEIKKRGKYFVKDEELSPKQKDEFRHEDISKNIINIIENTNAPFNIAVVGKWGIGKSSLIKNVVNYFDNQKNDYVVDEINAWKYEKEALRRVFLKNILEKLGYKDKMSLDNWFEKFTSYKGNVTESKTSFNDYWNEWKPILLIALIIYIMGVLGALIGECILSNEGMRSFSISNWISFVLTSFAKNFYLPILVVLIQQYIKGTKGKFNFKLTTPIKTTDEYEDELKELLDADKRKIIVIVDDLDRLTPDKIVEALDAIKAFVNYDNCIFIVPFDDSILKQALKRKEVKLNKNEDLLIESELFLDKLFQYKIYLPNIIASDLPEYAYNLVNHDAPDLCQLFSDGQLERICKEVLIHKGVSTPRQVKKILNSFSNNVLLLLRREESKALVGVFQSESGLRTLAKISVLQADFSDFYSKMFIQSDLISIFIKCVKNDNEHIPESLEPYFIKDDNEEGRYLLNKSAESLYNFLCKTSNIICDNFSPYLYMANDTISAIFGSEFSREIRNSMTSGAEEIVRRKIEESKESNFTDLFENVLAYADPTEFENCCIILINILEFYNGFDHKSLVNMIGRRVSSIYQVNKKFDVIKVNFNNLFNIYCESIDKNGLNNALVDSLKHEDESYCNKLDLFFANDNIFSNEAKYVVNSFVSENAGFQSKTTLLDLIAIESIDLEKHFSKYFGSLGFFGRLVQYVVENGNEDIIADMVYELFKQHIKIENINNAILEIIEQFTDEEFYNILADQLYENAKSVQKSVGSKLILSLIQIENQEDRKNINHLLSKMQWSISMDNKDEIDNYILENINDDNINEILDAVIINDQVTLIPKSINNIAQNIVLKPINYDIVDSIQVMLSQEQKSIMINSIARSVSYNSSPDDETIKVVFYLLERMIKDSVNRTLINSVLIPQLYTHITSQPNTTFANSILKIVELLKDIIDVPYLNNFIAWVNDKSHISNYPNTSISILDILKDKLEKEQYSDIAKNVMTYANVDALTCSLRLLRYLRKTFKEFGLITDYKTFLVNKINVSANRKEIIQDIGDFFSSIGDVPEFLKMTIMYEDIQDQVEKLSVKFLNNSKEVIKEAKLIIENVDSKYIKITINILKGYYGEKYNYNISKLVNNTIEGESLSYIYNLFIIILEFNESYTNDIILLSSILLKQGDVTIVIDLLSELDKLPKGTMSKTFKRELGDSLYDIFRRENKESVKMQIFEFVDNNGIKYMFEKHEDKSRKEFTDEENVIIKKTSYMAQSAIATK